MNRETVRSTWPLIAGLSLALALGACATNPVQRRAGLIAEADQQAKRAIAAENQIDAGKMPARTFAVLPFTVAESDTLLRPLGYGLAELLVTDLSHTPSLRLVERMRIGAMLRELDLVEKGVVEARTAPRVGKLIGARRLLIGEISGGGGQIHIRSRVVDVIAGTVQELVSADAPVDRAMDAEKALALLVLERLGITLTPAQRAAIEQRQTTRLGALVAFGRGVEAEDRGDAAGAIAAFTDAGRIDATFAAARTQLSTASTVNQPRASNVQRVLDLSSSAINAPVSTKLPEAVDPTLAASASIPLLITVRVTP